MKNKKLEQLLSLVEGALCVAMAFALDLLPLPKWPMGGSISISCVPIIYYSYRRGWLKGLVMGLANGVIQIVTGWYTPPGGALGAVLLCALLDYLLAFGVIGIADAFAKLFGKHRMVGYTVGAVLVNLCRLVCSYLSGITIWASTTPEGEYVWIYSLTYNASYMIPNAILAAVIIAILCAALDPKTLRPIKKDAL
ncbi:putative proton-coupled thiamine transporter YuaJ [Clostridium sp. CAG:448]|nr:putative proton-coupled thiamine transporter YuaJ [Clostridium sp. CAG:448]